MRSGARTVVVGLGGSGCDGGRGMVDALGGIDQAQRALASVDLVIASDVEHPLLGPTGAAAVFGPQKGADPNTVASSRPGWRSGPPISRRRRDATSGTRQGRRRRRTRCGAAGAGRTPESGAHLIAEHTGTAGEIARCDLLITGEGRLDDQSVHGKVVGSLAALARTDGVPVLVLAGQVALDQRALAAAESPPPTRWPTMWVRCSAPSTTPPPS